MFVGLAARSLAGERSGLLTRRNPSDVAQLAANLFLVALAFLMHFGEFCLNTLLASTHNLQIIVSTLRSHPHHPHQLLIHKLST